MDGVGANAKMNEFCAAMGLCNLRHIDENISKRRQVAECYRKRLNGVEGIKLMPVQPQVQSNYAYFPIVIDEKTFGLSRNEIFMILEKNGIKTRKYFYPLTNSFECFHGKYDTDLTPIARYISKRVLTLPLYGDLDLEDVEHICDIILQCHG